MISEKIYLYGEENAVALTTYRINESGELSGQGSRPAVLVCPGGGYFNCSDREGEPVALQFNVRGYHAFVLRYSTYDEGKIAFPDLSGEIAPNNKTKHPAPVRDIAKAMLYIQRTCRGMAGRYGTYCYLWVFSRRLPENGWIRGSLWTYQR